MVESQQCCKSAWWLTRTDEKHTMTFMLVTELPNSMHTMVHTICSKWHQHLRTGDRIYVCTYKHNYICK